MGTPENCRECKHSRGCKAWHYGADKCQHKDAVDRMRLSKEEYEHGNPGKNLHE